MEVHQRRDAPRIRALAPRDPRTSWFSAGAALALIALLGAWAQGPWPDPDREPSGLAWLFSARASQPWSAVARIPRGLPVVSAAVAPDGSFELGLASGKVLRSPDGIRWGGPLTGADERLPWPAGSVHAFDVVAIGGDTCRLGAGAFVSCDRGSPLLSPGLASVAVSRGEGAVAVAVGKGGAFVRRAGEGFRRVYFRPVSGAEGAGQGLPQGASPVQGAEERGPKEPSKARQAPPPKEAPAPNEPSQRAPEVNPAPVQKAGEKAGAEDGPPPGFRLGSFVSTFVSRARAAEAPSGGEAPSSGDAPKAPEDAYGAEANGPSLSGSQAASVELSMVSISDDGQVAWAVGPGVVARILPSPAQAFPTGEHGPAPRLAIGAAGDSVWTLYAGRYALYDSRTGKELGSGPASDLPRAAPLSLSPRLWPGWQAALPRPLDKGPGRVSFAANRGGRSVVVLDRTVALVSTDGGATFRRSLVVGREVVRAEQSSDLGGEDFIATGGGELLLRRRGGWRAFQVATEPLLDLRREGGFWYGSDGRQIYEGQSPEELSPLPEGAPSLSKSAEQSRAAAETLRASLTPEAVLALPDLGPNLTLATGPGLARAQDDGVIYLGGSHRWPAPWFYLALSLSAACLAMALRPRPAPPPLEETVATLLVSDRPIDRPELDLLDLSPLAHALADFVSNPATAPPLALAVTGEWGTGKSSVLNLLRRRLEARGHVVIPFNAWHHEGDQDLLASLFAAIIGGSAPRGLPWLEYRARLLYRRLTGRSASAVLVLALLLGVALALGAMAAHPAGTEGLIDFAGALGNTEVLRRLSGLGGVAATLALVVRLAKDFRGYGVDVAKLAASAAGSVAARDARAQIDFRERFARDFEDVVRANAQRRMVILIDDVDRCSPRNAVRVLEAVSFLSSSGDCFVVLAMSRRVVEKYVASGFDKVARLLAPAAFPGDGPLDGPEERYARAYLEKLINVEVAVPTASHAAERRLYAAPLPTPESPAKSLLGALRVAWSLVLALCVVAGVVTLGTRLDPSWLVDRVSHFLLPAGGGPASSGPTAPPSPLVAAPPGKAPLAPAPGTSQDQPWPVPDKAELSPTRRRGPLTPAVAVALGLALAALLFLSRRGVEAVVDSADFQDALRCWHPAIRAAHPTPRALKRFLNRLRLDAMRLRSVRPPEKTPGRLERALLAGRRWLGLGEPEPLATVPAAAVMPEPFLVALSALSDLDPDLLEPGSLAALFAESSPTASLPLPDTEPRTLGEVVKEHVSRFGKPTDASRHLERFRLLRQGVSVR
ncbi:MAG TPA: P-loop NTPase fold protein [Anaeromyxobacter sp.]|nr:P-loop NTPase fold protein [Anaeromyxobacter sp.]